MSYRLDPGILPSSSDSWVTKVVRLAGAVVLAVEELSHGSANTYKREQAIHLFMNYASQLSINIPMIPNFIETYLLRKIAGMMIDWLAGFTKTVAKGA